MENYYNKRPLWQWILIYVIIGGVVYGAIYYFYFYKRGGYVSDNSPNYQVNSQTSSDIKSYMIQNMKVEILQEGSGPEVQMGDKPTMNYTGWLENGTKFDSSLNPGRTPLQFTVGPNCALDDTCVIEGWNLGVTGMKVGEKRKLTIPPELAYGADGRPPVIPPSATLIFEVELLKIN